MRCRVPFSLASLLSCIVALAATAQTPALSRADSAFQQQDWPRAASLYGSITRTDSTNGLAWFRLGASLESQHEVRGAVGAYQHAAVLHFQPLLAELRLARSYAQLPDNAQALAHLRKAAAIGFAGGLIANDSKFEAIRRLPEYPAILKAAEDKRFPCRSQHEFDYWEGVFSVTPWDGPLSPSGGMATNTRQYEGCVFIERWEGPMNQGMSMVMYDVNRHAWRMLWNDDQNSSNDFEGEFRDGGMRFRGWVLGPSGEKVLTSNELINVSPDVLHHIYSTSTDSGRTWTVRSSSRWTRQH